MPNQCDTTRLASQITLDGLQLILQWPLLAPTSGFPGEKKMQETGWTLAADPLDVPASLPHEEQNEDHRTAFYDLQGFSEHVFFHDFVQSFLFNRSEKAPLQIWVRTKTPFVELEVDLPYHGTQQFDVLRHTLHNFHTVGIAVLTVELAWKDQGAPLTLATAQTCIDLLRRSYVPYWSTDPKLSISPSALEQHPHLDNLAKGAPPKCMPGRVPGAVRLYAKDESSDGATRVSVSPDNGRICPTFPDPVDIEDLVAMSPEQATAAIQAEVDARAASFTQMQETIEAFAQMPTTHQRRGPRVFDHWRKLAAPLEVGPRAHQWRDPSDERIPVLSHITLAVPEDMTVRTAMQQVAHSDWIRLVDAEIADGATRLDAPRMPYNTEFLAAKQDDYFYDRFMSDENMPDYMGTRQLFGGAHYGIVGAGGFHSSTVLGHFRRQYAQLALISRLEFSALLAFSSRLTEMVAKLDDSGRTEKARENFDGALRKLQEDFLSFTHRFRFTGVSSQIQPSEMFEKFRTSLGLDGLYADVKDEIQSAVDLSATLRAEREAVSAARLTQLATLGLPAGLALAAYAVEIPNLFPNIKELTRLGLLGAIFYIATFAINFIITGSDRPAPSEQTTNGLLIVIGILSVLACLYGLTLPDDPTGA